MQLKATGKDSVQFYEELILLLCVIFSPQVLIWITDYIVYIVSYYDYEYSYGVHVLNNWHISYLITTV